MNQKRSALRIYSALIAPIITPAIIWFFLGPTNSKFTTFSVALLSFGQLFGLLGMAMFSLVIIISARPVFLDHFFSGLNNLYKYHHALGALSFIFLLAHPLSLAFSYLMLNAQSAILFLTPSRLESAKDYGVAALLTLMIFLLITFLARIRYQYLKFFHKLLGVAYGFGTLHLFFISSDVSRNTTLRIYMLTLIAVALSAYCYKSLLHKFLGKKYDYVVKQIEMLPGQIVQIALSPLGPAMDYMAGQFIFINFFDSALPTETHPFSLASSPKESEIRLAAKVSGDYTNRLFNLKTGTRAKIEGPFGVFNYSETKNKNQIWIAGGSGIAPFLGMLRDLASGGHGGYHLEIYYCVSARDEFISLESLITAASKLNQIRLIPYCSDEQGRISVSKIAELSGGINNKDVYLCGPLPMMKNLIKQFNDLKFPANNLHSEEFKLLI